MLDIEMCTHHMSSAQQLIQNQS